MSTCEYGSLVGLGCAAQFGDLLAVLLESLPTDTVARWLGKDLGDQPVIDERCRSLSATPTSSSYAVRLPLWSLGSRPRRGRPSSDSSVLGANRAWIGNEGHQCVRWDFA
jgi:hypothetical protein